MKLCYTSSLGGAPVVQGDTIPASQVIILNKPVEIVEWFEEGREIWCKVPGVVHQVCFPAHELSLRWVEDCPSDKLE